MDTEELWLLGEKHVPHFKGVYALNKLPKMLRSPASLIVNTHTHNLPGQHWIALSYHNRGIVFAFDPFGSFYPLLFRQYLSRLKHNRIHYSNVHLQEVHEDTCGLYCISWLILRYKEEVD
jgi:hypothetical protein